MAQYQSFPDAAGDSRTLEKLKALHLPSIAGRRFLDVGCNEGFFCGYAAFDGAALSMGLDSSAEFIDRARRRFPECEFVQQGWDVLPEGPFDVVLLASALHYAEDQPALIHALMSRLSPDGVLVVELGIASSPRSEWTKVKRGIDERYFPSMAMVKDMLDGYAWKWMGPSVAQEGDPVARHVLHVSRLRPVAYLLMQPPAYGKTTIARSLFGPATIPMVSGDEVIQHVAQGKREAPKGLRALLSADYSPYRIDETIRKAFDAGFGPELVHLWLEGAGPGDFAIDAYVPQQWHDQVRAVLVESGYMPVSLYWERAGMGMSTAEAVGGRAEAYYLSLKGEGEVTGERAPAATIRPQGFVDDLELIGDRLTVRGWVVDESGRLPKYLSIKAGRSVRLVEAFERGARPDVQRHLGLASPMCGYVASVPVDPSATVERLAPGFELRVGNSQDRLGPPLPFAGPLASKVTGGKRG